MQIKKQKRNRTLAFNWEGAMAYLILKDARKGWHPHRCSTIDLGHLIRMVSPVPTPVFVAVSSGTFSLDHHYDALTFGQ